MTPARAYLLGILVGLILGTIVGCHFGSVTVINPPERLDPAKIKTLAL